MMPSGLIALDRLILVVVIALIVGIIWQIKNRSKETNINLGKGGK